MIFNYTYISKRDFVLVNKASGKLLNRFKSRNLKKSNRNDYTFSWANSLLATAVTVGCYLQLFHTNNVKSKMT